MQAVRLASNDFKIFMLVGGATSKIGDPSDKLKERPILHQQVLIENQGKIEAQLEQIFAKTQQRELVELQNLPLELFFGTNQATLTSIYKVLNLQQLSSGDKKTIWKNYLAYI